MFHFLRLLNSAVSLMTDSSFGTDRRFLNKLQDAIATWAGNCAQHWQ